MTTPRRLSRRRGMTLVEGMISTGVLIIGMIGAFQGIIFASQQNAVAARLSRGTAMATQIRHSLERHSRNKMVQPTGLFGDPGKCVAPSATHLALTDGASGVGVPGTCVVDLDVIDTSMGPDKVVGKYDLAEDYNGGRGFYKRLLVYVPGPPVAVTVPPLPRNPDVVTVVVVVRAEFLRNYVIKQHVAFYETGAGTEL